MEKKKKGCTKGMKKLYYMFSSVWLLPFDTFFSAFVRALRACCLAFVERITKAANRSVEFTQLVARL